MSEQNAHNYFWWVVGSFFLFWPTAIVALIHSIEVDNAIAEGAVERAGSESATTKNLCVISTILGVAAYAFGLVVAIVVMCCSVMIDRYTTMESIESARKLALMIDSPKKQYHNRRAGKKEHAVRKETKISTADQIVSELIDDELSFKLRLHGATDTEIQQLKRQLMEQFGKMPEGQRVDAARHMIHEIIRMHGL